VETRSSLTGRAALIWQAEVGLDYTYYSNPTSFRGVYPTGGPIQGGTLMTFHGQGFAAFGAQV
jgi:hypothetical protein